MAMLAICSSVGGCSPVFKQVTTVPLSGGCTLNSTTPEASTAELLTDTVIETSKSHISSTISTKLSKVLLEAKHSSILHRRSSVNVVQMILTVLPTQTSMESLVG